MLELMVTGDDTTGVSVTKLGVILDGRGACRAAKIIIGDGNGFG